MHMMDLPEPLQEILQGQKGIPDRTGKSGAKLLLFPDMVLKVQPETAETRTEHAMMTWLQGRLPVPRCLYHTVENGTSYLLMTRAQGKMACDEAYMQNPKQLTRILAEALHRLWQVDITDCPVRWDLPRKLAAAATSVEKGEVDTENAEPETFGTNGFRDPADLLSWLQNNQPPEDLVLSHGDFCLPNIFIENGNSTGFIDLGRAGVADRWQDIALCYRSLVHNYTGKYARGRTYTDFQPADLFTALDIRPDWQKLRYYILLDELF